MERGALGGEGSPIGEAKEDVGSQEPLPETKFQADGSVEGESDGEDDNAEARIYAELIEEQQAKKRAAALDGLNEINTGQAFNTLRVLKKNEETLKASGDARDRLPSLDLPSLDRVAGAGLKIIEDLSSLLPGPAFGLPGPAFKDSAKGSTVIAGLTPTEGPSTSASTSASASATPREENSVSAVGLKDAAAIEAAPGASVDSDVRPSCPSPQGDGLEDGDEMRAKLMATWQYAEVTGDGGVALAFGGLDESQDISRLYEALGHEEMDAEGEEEAEAAMLQALAVVEEEGEAVDSPPDKGLPPPGGPRLDLASNSLAFPALALALQDVPSPSVKFPAKTPAEAAASAVAADGSMAGPSVTPPEEPLGMSAPWSTPPRIKEKQASFRDNIVPAAKASLNTSLPTRINKEQVRVLKKDLSRTIREELQRSNKPMAALLSQAALAGSKQKQETMISSIRVGAIEGKIKPINIVMLIVGTRGDVQPFIGIGLKLKEYGHRVRIASHKVYREFVTGFGLEFYPIGGDPKVLSEFVVKHRGIMPGLNIADAIQQREQVKEILYSSWGACVLPDPEHPDKPFIADAIIANPPAYGHTHCAEKLNVPLHIIFTMPWSPTKAFPNPFARIKTTMGGHNSKAREIMNWLSYFAVEDLAWLGMSGMVKDFRKRILQLTDWSKENGSHTIHHSKVPVTYIWSPSLVPRPPDWPHHCEVVGFINVELQKLTKYTPPKELKDFLDAGPAPVYIGFGSLILDNPEKLTQDFLKALKTTGLRAIIQKGWGGLGTGIAKSPDNVLFIGQAPHDWLFERCCAVVHHGGAGTTACGLHCGKPTFIVPFFGDQPFWGAACVRAGVGPEPVPIDDLTADRIVEALKVLILPTSLANAKKIQAQMSSENGIEATVDHLHRTIYGALLAGKTFTWMKHGAGRSQILATSVQEDAEDSSFMGRLTRLFTRKGANAPKLHGVVSTASVESSVVSETGLARRPSFHINAVTGAVIGMVPPPPSENGSPTEVPIGPHESRKGVLSWLGC